MTAKIVVEPQLLKWARERASLAPAELAEKLNTSEDRVLNWEVTGELSLSQLEKLASRTNTPVGYLFLPAPPQERLPIQDFRTIAGDRVRQPSPNLLETIYQCQRRQDWYRDHQLSRAA